MQSPKSSDDGGKLALTCARRLLQQLGISGEPTGDADPPALAWRRAGLMEITGLPDRPGLVAPVALTAAADGALAALRAIAPGAPLPGNGASLLGERARLLGLKRRGARSPNDSCRLLAARGGCFALNLPRKEDWELIPALLGDPVADWSALARIAAQRDRDILVERGRLLGLAIAPSCRMAPPASPFRIEQLGEGRQRADNPLVIDLSSLWAGPLAGSLLRGVGARVLKVESCRRPDGARAGNARFFDLLNGGKASVALDFSDIADMRHLRRLIDAADIVIESARPRALAQLGICAEEVAARGATWLSITAHGRVGEAAHWIGFGDDAAVAGGLAAAMERAWGKPLFAGDALADPLTGITAALAGWASWRAGGARLVSLALADVVAHACGLYETTNVGRWQAMAVADAAPLYPLREPAIAARPLGADTRAILTELAG